jgi:hypothetical protein
MSIFNFAEFVNKIITLREDNIDIMFNCARLINPRQFDLRLLPDYCDIYFQETNKLIVGSDKIKNVERETWQMVYDFWESRHISMLDEERSYLRDQFVDFINEYDKRRNKDFSQIFPEFNDWD